MDNAEKQWNKVEKLFDMISEEYVRPDEAEAIFSAILALIEKQKQELEQKMAQNKGEMTEEAMSVRQELLADFSTLEGMMARIEEKANQKAKVITEQIKKEINTLREEIPSPTDLSEVYAKIDEVSRKIPEIPEIPEFDTAPLEEEIAKLKDEIEKLKKNPPVSRPIFGGGFNYSALNFHLIDDETPTNSGDDLTFSLKNTPSPASSLKIYRNGQRLKLTTDYTVSGGSFTLTTALVSGEILSADYRT